MEVPAKHFRRRRSLSGGGRSRRGTPLEVSQRTHNMQMVLGCVRCSKGTAADMTGKRV